MPAEEASMYGCVCRNKYPYAEKSSKATLCCSLIYATKNRKKRKNAYSLTNNCTPQQPIKIPKSRKLKIAPRLDSGFLILVFMASCLLAKSARPWKVGSIDFTGNYTIPANKITDVMETRSNRLWRNSVFSLAKIQADLPAIETLYKEKGNLDGRATVSKVVYDSASSLVNITIKINEGLPTTIDAVEFSGASVLDTHKLFASLRFGVGSPLSLSKVRNAADSIGALLMEHGFLEERVKDSVRVDTIEKKASVIFNIHQGPLCFSGSIDIQGLKNVRSWVVARELTFKIGDTLTSKKIRESIRNLYNTGLFTFITISYRTSDNVSHADSAAASVVVTVDEAKFFTIDASIGYGTMDAFRTALRTAYNNIFYRGHSVSLIATTNRFGQQAQLGYSIPWIFSIPLLVDAAAFIERHEVTYRGLFDGIRLSISPQRLENIASRLWIQYENTIYLSTSRDTIIEPKNTRSIGVDFTYNNRQNNKNRMVGMLIRLFPEVAGLGGSGSNQYYRAALDIHFTLYLSQGFECISSLSTGYVCGYGSSAEVIPPQARFYIGMDNLPPIRGYSVSTDGGVFALVITPINMRFAIYKWFGVTLFADAGKEWGDSHSLRLRDMHWTAGPGLSMKISFAELRVDFPWYVNGKRGMAAPWVSIGNTF
jgi:outer membrane protein assembly factor BamA